MFRLLEKPSRSQYGAQRLKFITFPTSNFRRYRVMAENTASLAQRHFVINEMKS